MTLTGTLRDGTPFEATDCGVIRGGMTEQIAPAPGVEPEEEESGASFGVSAVSPPGAALQRVTYGLPE